MKFDEDKLIMPMCSKCFVIRKIRYRSGLHCLECGGEMVEIDELFALLISILNKKGYITDYCCSGHMFEKYDYIPPNAYISFKYGIEIPHLPDGYKFESDIWERQQTVRIRKYFKHNSVIEKQKGILQNALDTLEWAENLPYRKENYEKNI